VVGMDWTPTPELEKKGPPPFKVKKEGTPDKKAEGEGAFLNGR